MVIVSPSMVTPSALVEEAPSERVMVSALLSSQVWARSRSVNMSLTSREEVSEISVAEAAAAFTVFELLPEFLDEESLSEDEAVVVLVLVFPARPKPFVATPVMVRAAATHTATATMAPAFRFLGFLVDGVFS